MIQFLQQRRRQRCHGARPPHATTTALTTTNNNNPEPSTAAPAAAEAVGDTSMVPPDAPESDTMPEKVVHDDDDDIMDTQLDQQFQMACTLLRSTSLPQTTWALRTVCHRLRHELQQQQQCTTPKYHVPPPKLRQSNDNDDAHHDNWPFPVLLPVALRCRLDVPFQYGNALSLLQITYTLQSIYILLQLRAGPDHVVSYLTMDDVAGVTLSPPLSSFQYQIDGLNDVIPTRPIRSCYAAANIEPIPHPTDATRPLSREPSQNTSPTPPTTSYGWTLDSSSSSAEKDGKAFLRDPMWTLLSRMRMIPRLAQLLQQNRQYYSQDQTTNDIDGGDGRGDCALLPMEARQSICGILAMMGQRSPGAATAMVHHPTLLADALAPSFLFGRSGDPMNAVSPLQQQQQRYDPNILIPVLHFLCTLCRQSRVAAEGIYERISITMDHCPSGLLLHILLMQSNTLHQRNNKVTDEKSIDQSGASNVEFGVQQWAVILWRTLLRYGFGLDLLPTMVTLASAHLTLGFHNSKAQSASLAPEWYTSYAVALYGISSCHSIDANVRSILSSTTLQRQSIYHLQEIAENIDLLSSNYELLRLATAISMYWKALVTAMETFRTIANTNENESNSLTEFGGSLLSLLTVFNTIVTDMTMKAAMMSASCCIFNSDFNDALVSSGAVTTRQEIRLITFLEAILDLSLVLRRSSIVQMATTDLSTELTELEQNLETKIISELDDIASMNDNAAEPTTNVSTVVDSIHGYCLNRVQALIITFFCRENGQFHVDRVRAMAITVIGRLDVGEEYTALMLFNNHRLFHPSSTSPNGQEASPISALLLQELCKTLRSRKQLDHSCKLNFTSIAESQLCLDVQSLLTYMGENTDLSSNSSDELLPVGKYWLWKLLAGGTGAHHEETFWLDVLLTSLKLIDEMEANRSMDYNGTPGQLGDIAKLYYLTNICLQGEQALANDRVALLVEKLFSFYFYSDHWGNILDLANECRSHLDPKVASSPSSTPDPNSASENEAVKAILDPVEINSFGWSKSHIRSIETYVGDLYDSYLEYGVQYEFYTKSIRLFLVKEFPTKVRLNTLNRFRNTLHLLSLQDDANDIVPLLRRFLRGGMPMFDQSIRDDPEFIDGICSLYFKGSVLRADDKFVKLWAICVVARSFGISIATRNKSGLAVAKRRICSIDTSLADRIICSVYLWLKTEGSVESLIASSTNSEIQTLPLNFDVANLGDAEWEPFVQRLTEVSYLPNVAKK